jgi:SAM-dependent methyltransferase
MTRDDRERWDRQHSAEQGGDAASGFLVKILDAEAWQIPRGRALDLASGKGRNALFLAERGFDVVAMDISPVALAEGKRRAEEKHLALEWQAVDLEQARLPESGYDLIINFNYLQRSLLPQIKTALAVGGYVIFETYLIDQQTLGHPKNPAYLLRHNELLEIFAGFRILCYREGRFSDHDNPAFRAGIFAQKTAR